MFSVWCWIVNRIWKYMLAIDLQICHEYYSISEKNILNMRKKVLRNYKFQFKIFLFGKMNFHSSGFFQWIKKSWKYEYIITCDILIMQSQSYHFVLYHILSLPHQINTYVMKIWTTNRVYMYNVFFCARKIN